ncbi:MAG: hypothetical protein L6R36_006639 [Xanthoria steineri]|nr:MAG: hypothetical protein L6R36_006639 [Xanthoria steineri]
MGATERENMGQGEELNVFSGADSVSRYFDPDNLPLLPLVEIPSRLNPLRNENVRIYAKMLTAHPALNVKALPALNMLRHEPSAASKSIVEASSGSTVLSLAMAARALYGHDNVCAYVTNKKQPDQLRLLRLFGLKVALYGGLAQQEPHDPKGIMSRLRRLAKADKSVCYLGQYDNDHILLSCDQDKYSESWTLSTRQATRMLSCSAQRKQRRRECKRRSYLARVEDGYKRKAGTRCLDLRQPEDFETEHIPQSMSSPLNGLTPAIPDLFGDPDTLHTIWTGLQTKFERSERLISPKSLPIVILCYDGDTSQVATSILRAKGHTAFSVCGGFSALRRVTPTRKLGDED